MEKQKKHTHTHTHTVFRTALAWNWNRHVELKHPFESAAKPPLELAAEPAAEHLSAAQPAAQLAPKLDTKPVVASARPARKRPRLHVQEDSSNDHHVGQSGATFLSAPADLAKLSQSVPKEQGSASSRKQRSMPSRNPDSSESQASIRKNLESSISNTAIAPKSSNDISNFPSKNASLIK